MSTKKSIVNLKSFVLLSIFILLKIGVAHAVTHAISNDDLSDCDHCILVINSNENKVFTSNSYSYSGLVHSIDFESKPVNVLYKNPLVKNQYSGFYFNKPPPFTS